MPGPGEAIDAVGDDAADLQLFGLGGGDQLRINSPHAQSMASGVIQVADGGADHPGLQRWTLLTQPTQGQFGLDAALAAQQLVPFIEHHGLQSFHQSFRALVGLQQGQ